ncbi:MAG TPA: DEAD/DEAH box helicase, partial [Candidatus Aenigmarchaeota archaeon]|nr:DEAD/DEAH box helicase [Candidatus Aenigmarchaeota archaeon]
MSENGVVREILKVSGFSELNPVQKEAVEKGLFEGRNMIVAAPTASGKTLIAEMAALDSVRSGRKVVYIVPLKALATEKYQEFREKYGPLGIKTAISIGDLDSSDPWLANYDIIITTSEKFDSLLRHGIS